MRKITDHDRQVIIDLIEHEKRQLGSYNKVARKCDVNAGHLSNNVLKKENWKDVSDTMWVRMGNTLGHKFASNIWNMAMTSNVQAMVAHLQTAQEFGMCMGISEKAGSGKTASIKQYQKADKNASVFVMECDDWGKRQFLLELCQSLGIDLKKGFLDTNSLGKKVVDFFKQKTATCQPLLILDEADKLKAGALRFVITLFNKLEDECGIVLVGTENLRKEIESGRRRAVKGFDEIHSRLGRKFLELIGSSKADVKEICHANGIDDAKVIENIFQEVGPVQKLHDGKYLTVIEDMRRLKRLVMKEKVLANLNSN